MKKAFLKVYKEMPLNSRSEVVMIYDDEPISWNVINIEVISNTDYGKQILAQLKKMKFI